MTTEAAPPADTDAFERQRQLSAALAAPRLEGYEIVEDPGAGTYGDV